MKQKIQSRFFLFLLLVPFFTLANTGLPNKAKYNKEKTISKSFDVSANATLNVDNSFGNINVITWDESRIEFDITIRVSGNNDDKVNERLDGIDVDFSSSNNQVSAVTQIEKNKSNWWNWGKKINLKMEIDYVIKLPITNNVNLKNKFGAIALDKLKGNAKIRCDHGKITTKELLANSNDIEFNHSRANYFDYIKNVKISASHSDFTIAKIENLDLKAQHTRSNIEIAEVVEFDCGHGSITVDNVNSLNGESRHLTTRIGNIFKSAKLNTSHGSLKIGRFASKANSLELDISFTITTI